jgi:hypothetical protein
MSNCEIDIPPIYDGYSEYFVDVKLLMHTRLLQTLGQEFMVVYVDNWSEDNTHQVIGCLFCAGNTLGTNVFDGNPSSDNAVFRIKNMNTTRRINVELVQTDNTIVSAANYLEGYAFTIHCLITPIK